MMRLSKGLLVLLYGLIVFGCNAYALSVQPDRIEARLYPGQKGVGVHRVTNDTDVPVIVTTAAIDWRKSLFEQKNNVEVTDWLTMADKEFTLGPGQYKDVNFNVTLPFGFVGEKVAQIFYDAVPQATADTSVKSRIGVIVYAIAKDSERVKADMTFAQLSYFEAAGEPLYNVVYSIYNKGNVHIRPYGTIEVFSKKTKKIVDTITIEALMGIYPEKSEQFIFKEKAGVKLVPGKYYAVIKLTVGDLYEQKKVLKKKVPFDVA